MIPRRTVISAKQGTKSSNVLTAIDGELFSKGQYKLNVYNDLASVSTTKKLYKDLETFIIEQNEMNSSIKAFIAAFNNTTYISANSIKTNLLKQLILLHHESCKYYTWEKRITVREPSTFSFYIAGRILKVSILKANTSMQSDYSLLIFSPD